MREQCNINSYTHIRGYILRKVELILHGIFKAALQHYGYDASFYMLFIIILFRGRPLQGEGHVETLLASRAHLHCS